MRIRALVYFAVFGVFFMPMSSDAAELPVKPSVAVPGYDWSGFYVGANLGYGTSNAGWTNQVSTPPATFYDSVPGDKFSNSLSGVIGGGQFGYNFQNGHWVYGIETMFDASAIKGSHTSTFGAADDQFEARIKSLFMVSGRVGYVWNNFLAYGKAGIAAAKIDVSVSDNVGPTTGAGSDSKWLSGPTVGIGFEYGITPHLSLGVEYDYIRLNQTSYQLGGASGSYVWDVDLRNISILLARLNYRFAGFR